MAALEKLEARRPSESPPPRPALAGRAVGNKDLADEGKAEEMVGHLKQAGEKGEGRSAQRCTRHSEVTATATAPDERPPGAHHTSGHDPHEFVGLTSQLPTAARDCLFGLHGLS